MDIKLLTRVTLYGLLLSMSGTAFAADSESEIVAAYLAKKQVVASSNLAQQIKDAGRATCNIAFLNGTAVLGPDSVKQVRELADMLYQDRYLHIDVALNSHDIGQDSTGAKLARERAEALVRQLRGMGVNRDQVSAGPAKDPTAVAFNDLINRL